MSSLGNSTVIIRGFSWWSYHLKNLICQNTRSSSHFYFWQRARRRQPLWPMKPLPAARPLSQRLPIRWSNRPNLLPAYVRVSQKYCAPPRNLSSWNMQCHSLGKQNRSRSVGASNMIWQLIFLRKNVTNAASQTFNVDSLRDVQTKIDQLFILPV